MHPGFLLSHWMTESVSQKEVHGLSCQHTNMCVMCEHTREACVNRYV